MEKLYSKIDSAKLLHIIHRNNEFTEERIDVVAESEFLQMAALAWPKGKTFRPHKHILKDSLQNKVRTQESWVIVSGRVKAIFYDIDDTVLTEIVLNVGDCSITLMGAHNYEILEENTHVYEFKTGPYFGVQNDKIFL